MASCRPTSSSGSAPRRTGPTIAPRSPDSTSAAPRPIRGAASTEFRATTPRARSLRTGSDSRHRERYDLERRSISQNRKAKRGEGASTENYFRSDIGGEDAYNPMKEPRYSEIATFMRAPSPLFAFRFWEMQIGRAHV